MTYSLEEYIKRNRIFKLVCGAGNECAQDVERLTALYSAAGAQMFDISAKPEILEAAKRGIEKSGFKNDRFICVSVGMKGDPHILKAVIDKDSCNNCNKCESLCPNSAIENAIIVSEKCIGCTLCEKACPCGAISMQEKDINLSDVIPELVSMGIDCIELHATSEKDEDIWDKWEIINRCFDGMLSICIDRLNLGNKQVLERLSKMLECRKPYTTIIQADGIPMSGCDDEYKTTLQAVAMAEIVQDFQLPVYIFLSGGTNSKTTGLADMCKIDYQGVAIGSYARKIVKPYVISPNFYENAVFKTALNTAKSLTETVYNSHVGDD